MTLKKSFSCNDNINNSAATIEVDILIPDILPLLNIGINPLVSDVHKMVTHTITILLQNCYSVVDIKH